MSAGRSSMVSPLVGMGAPMVTNTWPLFTSRTPRRHERARAAQTDGHDGNPRLHGQVEAALLEGAHLPVARARALGKITTETPPRMRRPASSMLRRAATAFCRSMKMKRPAHMTQPRNGMRASSFLEIMRTRRGIPRSRAHMSTVEAWLAMNT
jgi:hypothetical protein